MSRRALAVALAAGIAAAATSPAAAKLRFERVDGTAIAMTGTPRVFCGPWDSDAAEPALHIVLRTPGRKLGWQLSAVRRDIRAGRRMTFPNSFVFNRPRRADLFVYDAPNEASTQGEDSRGSVTFTRIACTRGGLVAFRIDATVDSEFGDGDPIRVTGSFRGRVSHRP